MCHKVDEYYEDNNIGSGGSSTDYIDIAGGNTVSFTPTSTSDKVYFSHWCSVQFGDGQGVDTFI